MRFKHNEKKFVADRIINMPGSPNHGKRVKVDFDGFHYNSMEDKVDPNYVRVVMADGRMGSIHKDHLDFLPVDKGEE